MVDTSPVTEPHWQAIRLPLDLLAQVVHVVRVPLDVAHERWNELLDVLTVDERQRAERFRFDEPRRRFVVCRAALRQLLAASCGIAPRDVPLRYGLQGKPELACAELGIDAPQIEFSVSHSRDLGLIAMTLGAAVGVDIEECNPKVKAHGLAVRFFSVAEAQQLAELPAELLFQGFYRGWTCKEAYIKATGRGLSLPLNSFVVTIDPRLPAALVHVDEHPNEPLQWSVKALEVGRDYAGAVMVARPDCRLECWDWPKE
jgi:4'-phosphopantetheinyl transferase